MEPSILGRHRTVTASFIAHLAEIYTRKLHVVEGFSYLGDYCVGALGMSEDEANRRAHAAVLAQTYPVILDMLLEGSIHLTTLRIIGKCLTPQNHAQVLGAARGKNKTELEHLAALLCPKSDVPTVLRKLPEPKPGSVQSEKTLFMGGKVEEVVLGTPPEIESLARETEQAKAPSGAEFSPDQAGIIETPALEAPILPVPLAPPKSRLAPLSPHRYSLQVTVDEETYNALKQLQDLQRHRNGDLARIIKGAVLERLERVKREKFGHRKHPRKAREQESWIEVEETGAGVSAAQREPVARTAEEKRVAKARTENKASIEKVKTGEKTTGAAIAPGRFQVNSRHIPTAVKREVWSRDKGQCAFVSRSGRRCSEKGRLEFHHVHAYALGGPATVENIALFYRAHNAHEGAKVFGKTHPGAKVSSGANGRTGATGSDRLGANAQAGSAANPP